MNQVLRNQIRWPKADEVAKIVTSFKAFYELLLIYNAIDETNIHIVKLGALFVIDYYNYKSRGHNIQLQVVVVDCKRFYRCVYWYSKVNE
jgi:hypothetical protein